LQAKFKSEIQTKFPGKRFFFLSFFLYILLWGSELYMVYNYICFFFCDFFKTFLGDLFNGKVVIYNLTMIKKEEKNAIYADFSLQKSNYV
jgi:hypothetical protein